MTGAGGATLRVAYVLGQYGERAAAETAAGEGIDLTVLEYGDLSDPNAAVAGIDLLVLEADDEGRDEAVLGDLAAGDGSLLAVRLTEADAGAPWYRTTLTSIGRELDHSEADDPARASLSWRRAEEHFYRTDLAGRFVSVNPAKAAFHDATPEAMRGQTDIDVFPLRYGLEYFFDNHLTIETGEGRERKLETVPDPAGGERVVAASKYVRTADDGTVLGIEGVSSDETARVKTRAKLRRTNANLRTFVGLVNHNLYNELQKLGGALDGPDDGSPETVERVYAGMTAKIDSLSRLLGQYAADWSDGATAYGAETEFAVGDVLAATLSAPVSAGDVRVRSERATVETIVRQLDAELVARRGPDYDLEVTVSAADPGFEIAFAGDGVGAGDGPLSLPRLDPRGHELGDESDVRRLLVRVLAEGLGWELSVSRCDDRVVWHVDPEGWLRSFEPGG